MHRIPPRSLLEYVLASAMKIDGAIGGTLHVCGADRALELLLYRGFDDDFPDKLTSIIEGGGSACGQAMAEHRRVVVRDVDQDPGFQDHLEAVHSCGIRAVQATPLLDSGRRLLGVLSTYFANPHHPSTGSLADLDRCCHAGALLLECERLRDAIEALDRKSGMPFRAISPDAAQAANTARTLLPLLVKDSGQVLLVKVETNLAFVATELDALHRRLAVA